jgi:hypothetical protein
MNILNKNKGLYLILVSVKLLDVVSHLSKGATV